MVTLTVIIQVQFLIEVLVGRC